MHPLLAELEQEAVASYQPTPAQVAERKRELLVNRRQSLSDQLVAVQNKTTDLTTQLESVNAAHDELVAQEAAEVPLEQPVA